MHPLPRVNEIRWDFSHVYASLWDDMAAFQYTLLTSWFLSCLCASLSVRRWTRTREQRISARQRTACTSAWPCWPLCWADRSTQDFSPETRASIGTPAFFLPLLKLWIPPRLSFNTLSISIGHIRRHCSSARCAPHTCKRRLMWLVCSFTLSNWDQNGFSCCV